MLCALALALFVATRRIHFARRSVPPTAAAGTVRAASGHDVRPAATANYVPASPPPSFSDRVVRCCSRAPPPDSAPTRGLFERLRQSAVTALSKSSLSSELLEEQAQESCGLDVRIKPSGPLAE